MRMSILLSFINIKVVFLLVGSFLLVLAVMNWLGVLGDWYYLDTGSIAQAQLVYIQMTHWVLVGALGVGHGPVRQPDLGRGWAGRTLHSAEPRQRVRTVSGPPGAWSRAGCKTALAVARAVWASLRRARR